MFWGFIPPIYRDFPDPNLPLPPLPVWPCSWCLWLQSWFCRWPQETSRFTPQTANFCQFTSWGGTRRPRDTPQASWFRTQLVSVTDTNTAAWRFLCNWVKRLVSLSVGFFPWIRLEISALSQSTTWCKHCDEASHFCTSVKYPTNHNHYNMSRGCNLTDLLDVDLNCFYWHVWASTRCSFIVASWLSFLWGVSGLTLSGNKLRLCRRRSAHLCLDRCPCDAAENGCMDDFSRAFFVPTGSDISDFIHNIESQDIKVEMMKQSDYMAAAPHSAAINVTRSSKVTLILHRLNLITDIRLDETGAPPPTFNVSRCSCCSQSALCLRAAGSSNWELSV